MHEVDQTKLNELSRQARKISGDVANYHQGLILCEAPRPDNLLIFMRRQAQVLVANIRAYHNRFVLVINIKATGKVIVDDMLFNFTPGQAILIQPFQFHHYSDFVQQNIEWLFITFELPNPGVLNRLRNNPVWLTTEALGNLVSLSKQYAGPHDSQEDKNRLLITASLLLQEMLKVAPPSPSLSGHNSFAKVGSYIMENLDQPLRLADLAKAASISTSHLRNLFKQELGLSLGRYVRQLRLLKAGQLIVNTDENITAISSHCGFDSLYAFSRAFRSVMGRSPLAYRKKYKIPISK